MKALVLTDRFDNHHTIKNLKESLNREGIECIPTNWEKLLESIYHQNLKEPFLLYWSAEMRIAQPAILLKFMFDHPFAMAVNNTFPVAINPQKVFFESYRFYAQSGENSFFMEPHTEVGRVSYLKPDLEPPRILFHTTGHRLDYLKMTINSLIYSLVDESVPITFLINDTSDEALNFIRNIPYQNKEILINKQNPGYAGINLLLQYYDKPKRFIAMEDDVILPQITKDYFPNWPYLFIQRLDHVEFVGWMCETNNRPKTHCWPIPPTPLQHGWYHGNSQITYPIMGQCFATTWDHYKMVNEKETFISRDENLVRHSTNYTAPFIKPYHIGWNQEMDGYQRIPKVESYKFLLENISKNTYREIDIRDIVS